MSIRTYTVIFLSILTVLLLTAAVYWQGLSGPFLLDDTHNIQSTYVDYFDWDEIVYTVTHNTSGLLGRPVSVLSLLFSGIVHGPGSWGYKFHNLAIHLITGLLIFWLLLKLLPSLATQLSREKVVLVAGITASVWLLHPLMISTVLYAVQRMAQLSSLFTLVGLLIYVAARENVVANGAKFFTLAYFLFPLAFIFALLSKENGALISFYLLAIEMIVFRFNYENTSARNRMLFFQGVFVALPLILGAGYLLTHTDQFINYATRNFNMAERLLTELHVVPFYLKLILLPRLSDMSLFHDDMEVVRQLDPVTGLLLLLLVAAVFLVFYLREKAPVISFAIAWFLVSHLMESTIISLELVFEHRNYLAAMGPLLAAIYYLVKIQSFPHVEYAALPIIMLLVFLTIGRVMEWKNIDMFNMMAITDHPGSYRAQTEYANRSFNTGEVNKALEHLSIAQEINKTDFGAVVHEALYRCGSGADVSYLLDEALSRATSFPITPYGLNSIENLLNRVNNGECPEVGLDYVYDLVEASQGQEGTRNNTEYLGFLERLEGEIHMLRGDYIEGAKQMILAYEHSKRTIILMELLSFQLQLKRLNDAEHLLTVLEEENEQKHGIETSRLKPLREKFESLYAEMEADSIASQPEISN